MKKRGQRTFNNENVHRIKMLGLTLYPLYSPGNLAPRPQYYARPMHFGSRGPFVSETSPKCIDREGLERRRTRTRQVTFYIVGKNLAVCFLDQIRQYV